MQAGAYRRLRSVTARVSSAEEVAELAAALTQQALPELHTLALLAAPSPAGGSVQAQLAALEHSGLTRLVLQGVELEGGFEGLQQLAGAVERWGWEFRVYYFVCVGGEAMCAHTVQAARRPRGGNKACMGVLWLQRSAACMSPHAACYCHVHLLVAAPSVCTACAQRISHGRHGMRAR